MKIFKFTIIAILFLYSQFLLAPEFELFKVIPNFLLAFIFFSGMEINEYAALTIAFFLGLAFDLTYPALFGFNAMIFVVITYIIVKIHKSVSMDKISTVLSVSLMLNLFYYIFFFIFYALNYNFADKLFYSFLISILYNTLITSMVVFVLIILNKLKISFNA